MASSPRPSDAEARMQAAAQRAASFTATRTQQKVQEKVQEKAAPKVQVEEAEEEEQQVQVADRTAAELKMQENPFFQAFEAQATETTQEDKILALANALDPKQQTTEKLRENYLLFQEYYTYLQSEDLGQMLENISHLIQEVQGRSKVEVAEILQNLRAMLDDVAVSRDLIEVMRRCRIDGTTVKELADAYDRNEKIVRDLVELEGGKTPDGREVPGALRNLEAKLASARQTVDRVIKEREQNESGLGFWAKSLIKKDTTYSDKVVLAQTQLDHETAALADMNKRIAELKQARKEEFEKEPLKILRSLDEADDNLSQRLVMAGKKGIDTIQGAQRSTLQLMQRAFFSEAEVEKIARSVTEKRITLANLRSGLVLASKNTNEFKQEVEKKSNEAETALAAAKAPETGEVDVLTAARLEDTALHLKGQASEVIDYQGRLNDTINEITGTVAKTLEREQETDRNRAVVQGTKKFISMLGRDTLNTVAGNLQGVLHNLVADQTDEVQNTIYAFGQTAQTMNTGMLQTQMGREREMHAKDMSLIDDTVQRLQSTTALIAEALERSVDEGIAKSEKQRQLEEAARGLDTATTTMRQVIGEMSDTSVRGRRDPVPEPQETQQG